MKIKIGKNTWEIVTAKDLGANIGETRFDSNGMISRQIVLHEQDKNKKWTLFHELLHCASFDKKLNLSEKQVLGLEKWFMQLEKNIKLNDLLELYK